MRNIGQLCALLFLVFTEIQIPVVGGEWRRRNEGRQEDKYLGSNLTIFPTHQLTGLSIPVLLQTIMRLTQTYRDRLDLDWLTDWLTGNNNLIVFQLSHLPSSTLHTNTHSPVSWALIDQYQDIGPPPTSCYSLISCREQIKSILGLDLLSSHNSHYCRLTADTLTSIATIIWTMSDNVRQSQHFMVNLIIPLMP